MNNRQGEDATNELSFMCLQATANTKLYQPSIPIRIHDGTPAELYKKAAEVSRLGLGMPAYYNDRFIIPALLSRGLNRDDARDYGIIGCVEPQVGGKTEGWHDAAFFNMAKVMELALNDGVDPTTGKLVGLKTGDLTSFNSFDDVMAAYSKQMAHFVNLLIISDNAVDIAHGERAPLPFLSSMVEDCIGKGKSLQEGGAHYNFTGPQGVGVGNVGDSLTAIKKLVFEDKAVTLADLKKGLCNANAINISGRYLTVSEVMDVLERDREFYERTGGGVTFSGGEPFAQPQFLRELARTAKGRNLHTAVETCGFVTWDTIGSVVDFLDLVLYDIKHMDREMHIQGTGVPNELILENLKRINAAGVSIRARLPLVPGYNDSVENIRATAAYITGLSNLEALDILPYHRMGEPKWGQLDRSYALHGLVPHTKEQLDKLVAIAREYGIEVTLGG